jgi:hypothetical protein
MPQPSTLTPNLLVSNPGRQSATKVATSDHSTFSISPGNAESSAMLVFMDSVSAFAPESFQGELMPARELDLQKRERLAPPPRWRFIRTTQTSDGTGMSSNLNILCPEVLRFGRYRRITRRPLLIVSGSVAGKRGRYLSIATKDSGVGLLFQAQGR